jgi:hypothetical protein
MCGSGRFAGTSKAPLCWCYGNQSVPAEPAVSGTAYAARSLTPGIVEKEELRIEAPIVFKSGLK